MSSFDLLWCAAPGYGWACWQKRAGWPVGPGSIAAVPTAPRLVILEVMRRTMDWQLGGRAAVQGPGEVKVMGRWRGMDLDSWS
jgi:hypothetical protein